MNWASFFSSLLKAKQSIIIILGQIMIFFFVFTSEETHDHKMLELAFSSAIFWIGYAFLSYQQRTAHDHNVKQLELDFESMTGILNQEHHNVVQGLNSQIHLLQDELAQFKEDKKNKT